MVPNVFTNYPMPFKCLSLLLIYGFTSLMIAILTAGNTKRSREQMMFAPEIMSGLSTTHLVYLGDISITATARVKKYKTRYQNYFVPPLLLEGLWSLLFRIIVISSIEIYSCKPFVQFLPKFNVLWRVAILLIAHYARAPWYFRMISTHALLTIVPLPWSVRYSSNVRQYSLLSGPCLIWCSARNDSYTYSAVTVKVSMSNNSASHLIFENSSLRWSAGL